MSGSDKNLYAANAVVNQDSSSQEAMVRCSGLNMAATEGNSEEAAINRGSTCTIYAKIESQKIFTEEDKILAGTATERELDNLKDYEDSNEREPGTEAVRKSRSDRVSDGMVFRQESNNTLDMGGNSHAMNNTV